MHEKLFEIEINRLLITIDEKVSSNSQVYSFTHFDFLRFRHKNKSKLLDDTIVIIATLLVIFYRASRYTLDSYL